MSETENQVVAQQMTKGDLRRWYLRSSLPTDVMGWICLGSMLLGVVGSWAENEVGGVLGWSVAVIWFLHANTGTVLTRELIEDNHRLRESLRRWLRASS